MPAIPPQADSELFRRNLAKGQTGLSVAFDLPTQTGHDADHPLARGEVGRVGVPIAHIGDMRSLFDGIPLDRMNTSMTINATAAWLLALYVAVADEQGIDRAGAGRHHAERYHQGISVARHLCLSARAVTEAYARHHILRGPPSAEMEPGERLLLPSSGGRGDDGAGARLCAGDGDRHSRSGQGQ